MTILSPDGRPIGSNGRGKKPRLPTLQELSGLRPWPLLTPAQFAAIVQQPTPLSEELIGPGAPATAVELIYLLYKHVAELEHMLADPNIPGTQ